MGSEEEDEDVIILEVEDEAGKDDESILGGNIELKRGLEFNTFKEIENLLLRYETENCVVFSIKRSELMSCPELNYKYVRFECKQSGETRHNPNLTGERPRQR